MFFFCSGSLLNPRVQSRSFLPYHARLRLPPENQIYQPSNASPHPHTSPTVISTLRMRKSPQSQPQPRRTSTCFSVLPMSLMAPFCSQIGRPLQPGRAAQEATPNPHRRCCRTAPRCRRSWLRNWRRWRASCGGTRSIFLERSWRTRRYLALRRRRWART